jgi:hypothetical protein
VTSSSIGVGRELVAFAERHCRDGGLQAMQLELLVPRTGRHPSKEFLDDRYRQIGYRVTWTIGVDEVRAGRSALLATPCARRATSTAFATVAPTPTPTPTPTPPPRAAIAVRLLDAAGGGDAGLVDRLTGLINAVYAVAEHGLWQGARPVRRRRR